LARSRARRAQVLQAEGQVLIDRHVRIERVRLEHHREPRCAAEIVVDALAVDQISPSLTASSPAIIRSSVDFRSPTVRRRRRTRRP
jgi:hypothetical protein